MSSLLLPSCSKPPGSAAPAAAHAADSADAKPASRSDAAFRYEVRFEAGRQLSIEGSFEALGSAAFSLDRSALPFVENVEFARGEGWIRATEQDDSWLVPCDAGCRIRYRFLLREACEKLHEADTAIAAGDVLIAPTSTWLLHPSTETSAEFELHVEPGPEAHFVTGLHALRNGRPNSYRAPGNILDDATYAAFGPLEISEIPAGDSTVQLGVAPRGLALTPEQSRAWVAASAGAVASFYQGHLPARHALVLLMKGSGDNTRGLTLGGGGPAVLVRASDLVNPSTTRDDWVLTHELLHANFPDIGRAHSWLSEGLATYVEPIARARVGLVSEAKVWRDMIDGMPQGLPQAGDQGLENTRTWGRTYWGGALFCLVADVTLRERTGNQHTLDDVLLAIGKASASDEDHWPLSQVLDAAQRATGTPVLRELYERLAQKPGTVDLPELFARLGVRAQGASVVFDDAAPLAAIRHSIAARRPGQ